MEQKNILEVQTHEIIDKIKSLRLKEIQNHKLIYLFFSGILLISISSYLIQTVFKTSAAESSIVHDTQVEFQAGVENRLVTSSDSKVQLTNHELSADEHTVGLWHMNESAGWNGTLNEVIDSSGIGNHGVRSGDATTTSTDAKLGGYSGTFDGTGDYVDFGSDSTLKVNDLTVSVWIKSSNTASLDTILARYDNSYASAAYMLYITDSNKVTGYICDGSGADQITSTTAVNDGEWHHIALTHNDETTTHSLYIDGVLEASGGTRTLNAGTAPLRIGWSTGLGYFHGQLDELYISNRVLTPEELKVIVQMRTYGVYTSEVLDLGVDLTTLDDIQWNESGVATGDGETPYSTTGLVGQWNFNENSGTTAANNAGVGSCGGTPANCDGTLTGFADTTGQDVVAGSGWTAQNGRWPKSAPEGLMFDGSNDYVEAGDDASLIIPSGTIEMWFKANVLEDNDYLMGKDSSGYNDDWAIASTSYEGCDVGKVCFWVQRNADSSIHEVQSDNTVTLGEWHHVVVTFGTIMKIYIDGVQQTDTDTITVGIDGGSSNLVIGGFGSATPTYFFPGTIDSPRIYSRVLSVDEILSNYQAGQIEFQTRTSADNATWEAWSPATSETQVLDFDSHLFNTTDTGLISYWAMDETSNSNSCNGGTFDVCDIKDDHGGNVNSDPLIVDGVFGKSRYFDGSNDWVTISGHSDFNVTNITLESWVYLDGDVGNTQRRIINRQQNNDHAWGLMLFGNGYGGTTGNEAVFMATNGSTWSNCSSDEIDLNPYKWYHVVGTHDGANQRVYINGQLANTCPFAYNLPSISADIRIGTSGGNFLFNGSIDEIRVYDNALPGITVQQHYIEGVDEHGLLSGSIHSSLDENLKIEDTGSWKSTIGAPTVDKHTVALWHLDETNGDLAGDDVFDSSINGNNGELGGDTHSIVEGVVGKALYFNGTTEFVSFGDLDILDGKTEFTISLWMKHNTITNDDDIFVIGHHSSGSPLVIWRDEAATDHYAFLMTDTGGTYSGVKYSSYVPVQDEWIHFALTFIGNNQVRMFINGNEDDNSPFSIAGVDNIASGNDIYRLGRNDENASHFNGAMDEVVISDIARTPEEIAESYRMGRDHRMNRTITSTNLSSKTKLPFWIAGDRPGTYLELAYGESAPANYLPDKNTVGLWHLEEKTGSGAYIKDSSSMGNHGTINGTSITTGKQGQGRYFDGSSDYITIGDKDSLEPEHITLSCWAKTDDYNRSLNGGIAKGYIFGSGGEFSYKAEFSSNVFYTYITDSSNTAYHTSTTIDDNLWHMWTMTYDEQTLKLYKDGVLKDTKDTTIAIDYTKSYNSFMIGARSNGSYAFKGVIDEVQVLDAARTADEIRQSYEIGRRTHPITIDFGASLDLGNLITGSGDTSFTIDATTQGFSNKGDNLYVGDKIIVKENYGGTEYIAQGSVASVNISTGAVTVSSWDAGATFPTGGYTAKATVFKWQREYFDIRSSLASHRDAVTNLTFRVTDGSEGRTVWLDDLRSGGPYLTNPSAIDNITSTSQRYLQYRFFDTTYDTQVTSNVSSVTINYNEASGGTPVASASDISGQSDIYSGKLLNIQTIYSDSDGASNLNELYFRIQNPSGTDIEYYGVEGVNGSGLIPTNVSGSAYVSDIIYDRSVSGNIITLTWHITVDWDWVEDMNVEYGVRATDDDANDSGWDYTNNDYKYENDLTFTGTLSVTGAVNGSLATGDWVQASESINWTGLTVVYEGTADQYPLDSHFDVRLTDDDTGSWDDLTSSGEAIDITSTSDPVEDIEDIHDIDIINIPSDGLDVSSQTFTIKVDVSTPDIVDITGSNEGVWQNTDSGPVISWTDPSSPSDDTFYITNDSTEPTSSNYQYSETSPTYDLPNQGEGETTVRVRPLNGAETYGTTYDFIIRYDVSNPLVDTLTSSSHPNESNWYIDDTPEFSWTTSDAYSGVEHVWRLIDQTSVHDASYTIANGIQDDDGSHTSAELSNGTWYFHLAVRDNVNYTNYDSYTVNIDDSAPIINSLTSPSHPNPSLWYDDNTPEFNWNTSDSESDVEAVWRMLDQTATHTASEVISGGTQDIAINSWTSGTINNGTWYFHLAVRNNAQVTTYSNFTVNIDTSDPVIDSLTSSSHPSESNWYSDNTPAFEWTTSDDQGVEAVWRILDQTSSHTASHVITNGTQDIEDNSWTSGNINNGTWYFHLAVRDNGGHTNYQNYTINVDNTVPDIVDVTGNNEGIWQNTDSGPVISWTDPSSLSNDTFYITNNGSTPTSGNYQYTTASTSYDLPNQGEGETTIKVRPLNGAGIYGITRDFIIRYDSIAPTNVSNLTATALSTSSIRLDWNNPSDSDFNHVLIKRSITGIPLTPNNGTTVYSGSVETFTDTNLSSGVTYYYTVFSYDNLYNYSSGAAISKTTLSGEVTDEEVTVVEETEEEVEEVTLIEELTETGEETEEIEQEELKEEEKNIIFIINGEEIEITNETELHTFQDSEVEAKVPLEIVMKDKEGLEITQVVLIIGNDVYIMKLDQSGEYYTTKFKVTDVKGEYDVNIIVTFSDETGKKISLTLTIDPYGYIYTISRGNELRIKEAEVSLYKEIDGNKQLWDTNTDQYSNPQYTNDQGEYSFFVEPGKYKLVVKATGYKDHETDWFEVKEHTVEKNIKLNKKLNIITYLIITAIIGSTILLVIFFRRRKRNKK